MRPTEYTKKISTSGSTLDRLMRSGFMVFTIKMKVPADQADQLAGVTTTTVYSASNMVQVERRVLFSFN